MPPLPSKIGNYEIVRQLGAGGMGTVFLGRDPELDRAVAIKMLRDQMRDQELLDRFFREARAAAALRHPNIITVYASGQHEFQPYIVMEFVDGESMADLIRHRRPVTLAEKLSYLDQLCAGLGFAHRAGIVHRDIKPANLMIDREGVLRILDFGIARIEGSGMTRDGAMVGTLNYMSPEQMLGRQVDHRSDIFAVGAVAYELLSYQQAFRGGLNDGLLQRLPYEDPPSLRDLCPGLPPVLEQTVMRALQKSPDHRFQSLAEMRTALADARHQAEADATLETVVVRPPAGAEGRSASIRASQAGSSPRDTFGLIASPPSSQRAATARSGTSLPRSGVSGAPVPGAAATPSPGVPAEATLPLGTSASSGMITAPHRRWLWPVAAAGVLLLAGAASLPFLVNRDDAQILPQASVTGDSGAGSAPMPEPPPPVAPATGTRVSPAPATAPPPTALSVPPEVASGATAVSARGTPVQRLPPATAPPLSTTPATAPAPVAPPHEETTALDIAVSDLLARVNTMYTGGDLSGALSALEQDPRVAGDPRVVAVARRVAAAAFDAMASAERSAAAQKATDAPAYKTATDARARAEAAQQREQFVDAGLEALAARQAYLTAINESLQRRAQPTAAAPVSTVASSAPPGVPAVATLLAAEQPSIIAALQRWAAAYEDGDMKRLKDVFPGIRREAEQALNRSFESNKRACRSFDVRFGRMEFSLNPDGRRVTVQVPTEYICTPRTGQAPPAVTQRDLFFLEKQGNDWFITQTSSVD